MTQAISHQTPPEFIQQANERYPQEGDAQDLVHLIAAFQIWKFSLGSAFKTSKFREGMGIKHLLNSRCFTYII